MINYDIVVIWVFDDGWFFVYVYGGLDSSNL